MTIVPSIVAISFLFGYVLAKIATCRYFAIGLLSVVTSMNVAILDSPFDGDLFWLAKNFFVPVHPYQLANYLVLYFSLPLATWIFGRRAKDV